MFMGSVLAGCGLERFQGKVESGFPSENATIGRAFLTEVKSGFSRAEAKAHRAHFSENWNRLRRQISIKVARSH
jgi:hypothetical protein